MASLIKNVLPAALLLWFAFSSAVQAADPDPLQDTPGNVTSFSFRNLPKNGVVSVASGGLRAALSVAKFPALEALGITYVRFEMVPCGSNLPHTHPRASEILTLVSGGPLQVGFVDTSGVLHPDLLYPGDVTVFPRGMLHFELNVGTEKALYFSALNSQNPGTLAASNSLAQIPKRALTASLGVPSAGAVADALKAAQPPNGGESDLVLVDPTFCTPGKDLSATD